MTSALDYFTKYSKLNILTSLTRMPWLNEKNVITIFIYFLILL